MSDESWILEGISKYRISIDSTHGVITAFPYPKGIYQMTYQLDNVWSMRIALTLAIEECEKAEREKPR